MSETSSSFFADAPFIELSGGVDLPHNNLQHLPPDQEVESIAVLKACIAARASLASLNETCRYFKKPGLIESSLSLLEAHASASLDGYTMSVHACLQSHAFEQHDDPVLEKILTRGKAMTVGLGLTRDRAPGVMTTLEICSVLEGVPVSIRRESLMPLLSADTGEPLYTAPAGSERLQRLLGNWEDFMHVEAANLDPLVIAAIAYYQFLAISPFKDNNGAVARIFVQLFFKDEELIVSPLLNISGYFRKHAAAHDRLLVEVTHSGHWEGWLLFFIKAVLESAETSLAQIRALSRLMESTADKVQKQMPRIYSPELLDVLFEKPYCRIQDLVKRDIAKRQTASQYLKKLCRLNVLSERQQGKEKLFINTQLVSVLTGDRV